MVCDLFDLVCLIIMVDAGCYARLPVGLCVGGGLVSISVCLFGVSGWVAVCSDFGY